MELGVTLRQSQEQRLLLLPKMLQAIEILQLSTRDLLAMIDHELSENETLEITDCAEVAPRPKPSAADDRPDLMGQVPAHSISLHAHLLSQVTLLELEPAVREIVSFLIGSLDGNGHLLLGDDEIAEFFPQDAPIAVALEVLRALEPRGVGTAGPKDSMIAQIDPADPDAEYLVAMIREHLDDLAKNRWPAVAKRLGVSVDDLKQLLGKLKALDPCPGRAFAAEEPTAMQPDVVVRREDGAWEVYVDDARVPPLAISTDYEALATDADAPRRVRTYLKKKIGSARELLQAIEQRKETLGRVARAVIDRQRGFLERGMPAIVPLKMQEVADAVGVHLSTVSRATSDKFVQTDFGVFPLRVLFDGGAAIGAGKSGKGGASRMSVKERVKRLIEAEDQSAPLSDDEVVRKLADEGLEIARRTVAKYRKDLGIPSSWRRRAH